jgi:hypothetical protein
MDGGPPACTQHLVEEVFALPRKCRREYLPEGLAYGILRAQDVRVSPDVGEVVVVDVANDLSVVDEANTKPGFFSNLKEPLIVWCK